MYKLLVNLFVLF